LHWVVRALIPSEPRESTHAEAEQLRQFAASDMESTADLEDTADLQDESTADRMPTNAPMPKQHALGFITFATCAVIAILFTIQRQTGSSHPRTDVMTAATPPTDQTQLRPSGVAAISAGSRELQKPAETEARQDAQGKSERAGASAPLGVVTFESRSFATSERAVAAVFIVKRTQFVRGRALVRWAARSGSADAGIDFSDASGTARFADGQRQLAIYVPLRNDLLSEEDETFKVCLRSPRQARIGGMSCAEATIRDDDAASRI
jgi:hypothetical protein